MRKVIERPNGTRQKERIYLGGFEVYREYGGDGTTVVLERETLHIMDDKQRIALVETKTKDTSRPPPPPTHPLPVRQPPRLGQPGVGRSGANHLLRRVLPLRQHLVSGCAQSDRDAETVPLHGQGAG